MQRSFSDCLCSFASVALLALSFVVTSCTDGHLVVGDPTVTVRLVSDFVPVAEASRASVEIFAGTLRPMGRRVASIDTTLITTSPLRDGLVVANLNTLEEGEYTLRATLRNRSGAAIGTATLIADVELGKTYTLYILSSCTGVRCDEDATCFAGACVDPRCTPDKPGSCGSALFCENDADCAGGSSCSTPTCVAGACVEKPTEGKCLDSEYCAREAGCAPIDGPVMPSGPDPRCGTICATGIEQCRYGYFACGTLEDGTEYVTCTPIVDRPVGASCGEALACDGHGACVDAASLDAGLADGGVDGAVDGGSSLDAGTLDGGDTRDGGTEPDSGVEPPCTDADGDRWCDFEDCDDNDRSVFPGAAEICDGKDNDCDERIDEGTISYPWYIDNDGDGFGATTVPPIFSCAVVPGRSLAIGDCDDSNERVYSGATEVCNDIDDDCNGYIDEGAICEDIGDVVTLSLGDDVFDGVVRSWDLDDVIVSIDSIAPEGELRCRSGKVRSTGVTNGAWGPCPEGPFMPAEEVFGADGLYRTDVRLAFDDGTVSAPVSVPYYLHESLVGATDCESPRTDDQWFEAARALLPTDRRDPFVPSAAVTQEGFAQVGNPFVHVNFTPPNNAVFAFGEFVGLGGNTWTQVDGELEVLSLRKHFVMSEDNTLVLVRRRYASRVPEAIVDRGGAEDPNACHIPIPSQMTYNSLGGFNRWRQTHPCQAVVMNREGAGVCLYDRGDGIEAWFGRPYWKNLAEIGLLEQRDNAMWRKLGAEFSPALESLDYDDRAEALGLAAYCAYEAGASSGPDFDKCVKQLRKVTGDPNPGAEILAQYTDYFRAQNGIAGRVGWKRFSPKCYGDLACVDVLNAAPVLRPYRLERVNSALFLPDWNLYRF